MKEWSKKQKITIAVVFAAILVIAGIAAALLNYRETQEGTKYFRVEITSERDGYKKSFSCESQEEYLGNFLRTFEVCEWQDSEYGIYISGFDGMKEDMENQYWWCVMVNGESSTVGADEVPLQNGDTYGFVLMQGW